MKDSLVNQLPNSKGLIGLTSYRFNSDRLLRSNKKKRFGKRTAVNRQGWICDDGCTHFVKTLFRKC